ncbi:hypothetical protein [Tenacibaculum singaporense]|uniref:Uncharacterized protein n=1 Tax=Tenacibaculum singaporense TaxID=2358479 RepID=A0A3S8R8S0_9FLAO|nr:hypothetical protein [Tenacibaculum singaporense]AZJ36190.1 hypothetical protein D6T69_11880 [Tenacibaculum singaporense]
MKGSLKSIGAFAQENQTLNNQAMTSVVGGKNGQYTFGDTIKYSTNARTEGGDTDCKDITSWGPTTYGY